MSQPELPGWRWGPFTFRLPFYHTKFYWQEALQGFFVAAATGLALIPVMTQHFGLSFEEAVAVCMIHSLLIGSALIFFGEPYAPGWITPALPLVLTFVLTGYEDPVSRFQSMTALSLNFAALMMFFGITGLGKRLVFWLPDTLKAGLILGAAIAAVQRVLVVEGPTEEMLWGMPISIILACSLCLIFSFSLPMQKLKEKYRPVALIAALGLLPGFIIAAVIGPLVGEFSYNIEWGILVPPVGDAFSKMSPFAIGWPSWEMFLNAMPLALITYVILFGDIVTGNEIIRDGLSKRQDEHIDINPTRTHLSVGIRNGLLGVLAPFFPTQGAMWTGVQVIIVQRWAQGKQAMNSLHSGLISYYLMGIPVLFFLLPLLTGLQPLLPVALALTLMLTAFACAYVAMSIPRNNTSRGTVLVIGAGLAFLPPWAGLALGILATLLMVGWDVNKDPIPHED